jgi:S-adenosylmethionine:tRNA ribosyltransferase-isomerase
LKAFANIGPEMFFYELPENRIAIYPVKERDSSRLLIREKNGTLHEDNFAGLPDHLPESSHIFFNNSKVIPARLVFTSNTGARIELFCLRPLEPTDYALALSSTHTCVWECMIGNVRRFTTGTLELKVNSTSGELCLKAERKGSAGNIHAVQFTWDREITFASILELTGKTPLPPYIRREPEAMDRERYQTVYSRFEGSVAAPTAGLHFTEKVLESLAQRNISRHEITLHVGAGTFQPIKASRVSEHRMHAEFFEVSSSLVQSLAALPEKVICVGTTTVRTLESLYWIGVRLLHTDGMPVQISLDQWEAYDLPKSHTMQQAFGALVQWFERQQITTAIASTRLMIVPGYRFRVTDTLITNFHQPGSTLLLLIAAFIGESWRDTYDYALKNGFRFLSYGDSSLLFGQEAL